MELPEFMHANLIFAGGQTCKVSLSQSIRSMMPHIYLFRYSASYEKPICMTELEGAGLLPSRFLFFPADVLWPIGGGIDTNEPYYSKRTVGDYSGAVF
jgi:hypothetical protein